VPRFATIDEVLASYPARFKPEAAAGVEGVVQLRLTGHAPRDVHLVIKDQTLDVREGVHDDPTLTVKADSEDWRALNNGAVGPMTLLMQGKVTFSGSLPLALSFRRLFETYA
jgi:putative sterol carrier protein